MSLDMMNNMDEFNLFEDLLPLGGISGSVEGVDDFSGLGNVFPGDSQNLKMAQKPESCDFLDLLSIDSPEDALKDGWMENMDLSHFLDGMEIPDSMLHDELVSSSPTSLPQEETKSNGAMNILHGLLTQPMQQISPPSSPEAQVAPEIAQIDLFEMIGKDNDIDHSSNTVEVESSLISAHDELDNSFVNSAVYVVGDDSSVQNVELDISGSDYLIDSPLSVEEIDSILSGSEPSSPSQEIDPDYSPGASDDEKCFKSKSSKSRSKKARVEPYELLPTEGLSKKERKRIQNKNAAIRYRMKKKLESTQVISEEDELLDKNKNLKEQVEQLQREIEYMKNLMSDVCKAKGLKLKFVKK